MGLISSTIAIRANSVFVASLPKSSQPALHLIWSIGATFLYRMRRTPISMRLKSEACVYYVAVQCKILKRFPDCCSFCF